MRVALIFLLCVEPVSVFGQVMQLDYEGLSVWHDCQHRGLVWFEHAARADTGSLPRRQSFSLDPHVPDECQQTSSSTYSGGRQSYDRGHLAPANHLDHLRDGICQSNFMINVLPQARNIDRGAWLRTGEIIECLRDEEDLELISGVIYGRNPHDDDFLASHGLETPDCFWKVIVKDDDVIAWIVPNTNAARRGDLDRYLISIAALEQTIGQELDIPTVLKQITHTQSWAIPANCDRS